MKPSIRSLASHISRPESYIVASKRTPFGAYGGKLRDIKASHLGGLAGKAALAELPSEVEVDQVFFGNVSQTDNSTPYLARHVGHLSGLRATVPALTVNRLCGSGFQTAITAAQTIALGEAEVCLTGGAEAMSMSPYTLAGASRFGNRYGVDMKLEDSLAAALVDQNPGGTKTPMGITAENLAKKYGISREECDAYALTSQQRYAQGLADGAFKAELTSVILPPKKGQPQSLKVDEHPRPQTTLQSLSSLASVFIKDTGVVSAGNASGICDGAAANVVMSDAALKKYNVKPLARIAAYAWSACEPEIMGIGPVVSVREALRKAGKSVADMDIIEVNEAFAAQWLAVQRELELPSDKTNMFGGAIALGHPLAASGARILANLTHNLHRLDKQWALGAACIGGGQGIAVILERCDDLSILLNKLQAFHRKVHKDLLSEYYRDTHMTQSIKRKMVLPDQDEGDLVSPPHTPPKKSKMPVYSKSPTAASSSSSPVRTPKKDGWTPEKRLRLFMAYEAVAQIKWDEVAAKMGGGVTGKMCREQWQRAMGSFVGRVTVFDSSSKYHNGKDGYWERKDARKEMLRIRMLGGVSNA